MCALRWRTSDYSLRHIRCLEPGLTLWIGALDSSVSEVVPLLEDGHLSCEKLMDPQKTDRRHHDSTTRAELGDLEETSERKGHLRISLLWELEVGSLEIGTVAVRHTQTRDHHAAAEQDIT